MTSANTTRAFSLIEVAIALGIVAVALVAILGVMPLGLSVHRDSKESHAAVIILNATAARLRLAALSDDPRKVMPEIQFPEPGQPAVTSYLYVAQADQTLQKTRTEKSALAVQVKVELGSEANDFLGHAAVKVRWPAVAQDSVQESGSIEAAVSLPARTSP